MQSNFAPSRTWSFRLQSLLLSLVFAPMLLAAQAVSPAAQVVGLLVVAHGADSGWNARVREVVREIHWAGPVEVAFLMGSEAHTRSWRVGMDRLAERGATRAIAVPLMVNSNGAHVRQMEYYAGELDSLPTALAGMEEMIGPRHDNPIPVTVTSALDAAPELGEILVDRLRKLPPQYSAGPIMLLAHGPVGVVDAARWLDDIGAATQPISTALNGATVKIGLLRDDADPPVRAAAISAIRDTIAALASRTGDSVTVITALISSGSIDQVKIPTDLAGLPIRYAPSSLAPHPLLAHWVERIADSTRYHGQWSIAAGRSTKAGG